MYEPETATSRNDAGVDYKLTKLTMTSAPSTVHCQAALRIRCETLGDAIAMIAYVNDACRSLSSLHERTGIDTLRLLSAARLMSHFSTL